MLIGIIINDVQDLLCLKKELRIFDVMYARVSIDPSFGLSFLRNSFERCVVCVYVYAYAV